MRRKTETAGVFCACGCGRKIESIDRSGRPRRFKPGHNVRMRAQEYVPREFLDLKRPDHAYLFGFVQTDGHLGRGKGNKGRFQVELSSRDEYILRRFKSMVPVASSLHRRTRDTNFKANYHSSVWSVSDKAFREHIASLGMPVGEKSRRTRPPENVSLIDYIRGLVDANGSVGMTGKGLPYLSLTTSSEAIKECFISFVDETTGEEHHRNRNKRDNVYNILVTCEEAQKVIARLYYPGALALPRKMKAAQRALDWKRPAWMKIAPPRQRWTDDEDSTALSNALSDVMTFLGRTDKSVKIRRWRLLGLGPCASSS